MAQPPDKRKLDLLIELQTNGLTTIAFSRHHWLAEINTNIMGLNIDVSSILKIFSSSLQLNLLKPRLICVLQKGGIESAKDIHNYLQWAATHGVEEICFKELYVSTSEESVYFSKASNKWSLSHQVPLKVLLGYFKQNGWINSGTLPWGAPIFEGHVDGFQMRVAAYTEPSLFWELRHGICRSWNIMADGKCLASLEDKNSEISLS